MSFDPTWNEYFESRHGQTYPSEGFIRFMARHYYSVPDRSQIKVLELGCGMGPNLWYLSREGFRPYGMDGSSVAIEKAKAWLESEKCRAEFMHGNILNVSQYFPPASFDVVFDCGCLQCNRLREVQSVLDQAFTLLKPGGRFFSLSLATGTTGEGEGEKVEPGTYININKGLLKDRGQNHFFTLEEWQALLSAFTETCVEYTLRTLNHREGCYKSWLAEGRKPLEA